MMPSLPADLAEFARHFYSQPEVDAAVDRFLSERGLELHDFAQMTEREFRRLVDDPEVQLDFAKGLNHSRVITGLMGRLWENEIEFLPNQSVYLRSELRCFGPYSSVHRVLVRRDGSLRSLCCRLKRPAAKTLLNFGDLGRRKLCSHCAAFNLDRSWHWL